MQAHIMSLHTASIPRCSQMLKYFFLKVVRLHIKLKRMEHKASCRHISCPYTLLGPEVASKYQNIFFESSHATYQIKGNGAENTIQAHILNPQMGSKGQSIFSKSSHVAYQIEGNGR